MTTHVLDQKRAKDAHKKYAKLVDRESKNKMDINSNAMARESVVKSCIDENVCKGYAKHYLESVNKKGYGGANPCIGPEMGKGYAKNYAILVDRESKKKNGHQFKRNGS